MKEKTILFDLDGTLIDSTDAILESFHAAFEAFGKQIPPHETIKAQIGHPLDVMFATLGAPKDQIDCYVEAYKMHYRQISCQKTVLLPQAAKAVHLASQHAKLGIVTTKTAKYSIELLEHMGIMKYFEVLVGREDVTYPKPHPEPILKAILKLQSDKNKCWMIGDTPMDILAAKDAGIHAAAVKCGYADEATLSSLTDHVYENAFKAVQFISVS
ncbi:MAG: Hydrolase [Campylobacterota bacterium]|nr:Hydrolase [Campylobacterota bacterium]